MHAAQGGMIDLNLNSDTPSSPSQVDNIFDPIYASFEEELKPLDINMPSFEDEPSNDFVEPCYDQIPVKPEILVVDEDDNSLENWVVPDEITENGLLFNVGGDETPYFVGEEDQFVGPDSSYNNNRIVADTRVNVASFGVGNLCHYYPVHHRQATVFGEFSVGTWNHVYQMHPNVIERRRKRMIKNRESAARSRARRMAYTAQQQLEIARLKEENGLLKRVLRSLVAMVTLNIDHEDEDLEMKRLLLRTCSAPLPPTSP